MSRSRLIDCRSVREGGRYSLLDTSTTKVRNSQLVTPHVRGPWCASKVQDCHENLNYWQDRRGFKCMFFAIDDMSRFPVIIDALSHLYARNRGHTLTGDDSDWYGHNHAEGAKVLFQTIRIVKCRPSNVIDLMTDELDRPRLPRCRSVAMYDALRPVPYLVKDTA